MTWGEGVLLEISLSEEAAGTGRVSR